MGGRFTDRATEEQIANSVKLFREYLDSMPREVFIKYYFLIFIIFVDIGSFNFRKWRNEFRNDISIDVKNSF